MCHPYTSFPNPFPIKIRPFLNPRFKRGPKNLSPYFQSLWFVYRQKLITPGLLLFELYRPIKGRKMTIRKYVLVVFLKTLPYLMENLRPIFQTSTVPCNRISPPPRSVRFLTLTYDTKRTGKVRFLPLLKETQMPCGGIPGGARRTF